jgi:hypothetical protein
MEPITHLLTGACIGRAGLNRKTAYATFVAVLAAEAADADVFWGLAGPVEELKHHRGITHTFLAAPVLAAARWERCGCGTDGRGPVSHPFARKNAKGLGVAILAKTFCRKPSP